MTLGRWFRPVLWVILFLVLFAAGRLMLMACGIGVLGYSVGFCAPPAKAFTEDLSILTAKVRDLEFRLATTTTAICVPESMPVNVVTPAAAGAPVLPEIAPDASTPQDTTPNAAPVSATTSPTPAPADATGQPAPGTSSPEDEAPLDHSPAGAPAGGEEPRPANPEPEVEEDVADPGQRDAAESTNCPATESDSAPPIVLVLDRSKSMGLPADVDDLTVAELDAIIASDDAQAAWAAQMLYDDMIAQPGRKRLDELKDAVVEATQAQLPARLISFAGCTAGVQDHGSFATGQRDSFLAEVMGLQTGPATPLAKAISTGITQAQGLAGARVLVISDGLDTCGGDPCTAAAASGGIPIDVISIGGHDALSCIAQASGGRVLPRSENTSLAQLIANAIAPAPGNEGC